MRESIFSTANIIDVFHAAGIPPPTNTNRNVRCPLPGHDDETPSFKIVGGNASGFRCFGCGAKGGVSDFVVLLGHARDRADAARWLEERIR